jgi:peptidoglycan/xylan/chitin deacetylase (PgdA/CDA1 family)
MRKRRVIFVLITLYVVSTSLLLPGESFAQSVSTQFQVVIDHDAHQRFGLYYPVTYMLTIPGGVSSLTAQYRFSQTGPGSSWINLDTKTSTDFFNGVNAARFDYANNLAYLSVAFSPTSDVIYLRILDAGSEVPLSYSGIPQYYDDRHAAVTVTMDDWEGVNTPYFITAAESLVNLRVHFTVGIVTWRNPTWDTIQTYLDTGYMEAAAHSRNHPYSFDDYAATGYQLEIQGSRDDILDNLSLAHPFVPVYIEPGGIENSEVREAVVNAGYLVERGYPATPAQNSFSNWGLDGAYLRTLYSYDTDGWPYGWIGTPEEDAANLAAANASFDSVYNAGGIYHLMDHPWQLHWEEPDFPLPQHINYISNKLDVWYASFGDLYLYHFVQENDRPGGKVLVSPVTGDTAFGPYTGPMYLPNANYRFTIQVAEMGSVPPGYGVCIQYSAQGGPTSTNACTCTTPDCNSGLGVWECNIPDSQSLHDIRVDWNISNWVKSGGSPECSSVSTLGPSSYFNTSPTAIKFDRFNATPVSNSSGAGIVALLLMFFASAWFWKISRQNSDH